MSEWIALRETLLSIPIPVSVAVLAVGAGILFYVLTRRR